MLPYGEISLTHNSKTQIQFPNVAVFQQLDFSSQANILPGLSKCFLGWYDDSAPKCSTLQTKDIDVKARCNCNESWSSEVIENFNWQGTTYQYLQFQTQPNLVSNQPTYLMMLQVFFNCMLPPIHSLYTQPLTPVVVILAI